MNLDEALDILGYDISHVWLANAIKNDALIGFIRKDKRALSFASYRINDLKAKGKEEKKEKQEIVDAIDFLNSKIKESK